MLSNSEVKKAVIRSQHCQRNFNLEREMPQEDIDLLVHAATNCPSKQNASFYNLHVITNQEIIEKIHQLSPGALAEDLTTGERLEVTNSQVKANVLFVFEDKKLRDMSSKYQQKWTDGDASDERMFIRDKDTAIGIAAGYLNVIASLMHYGTGCCQCFAGEEIQKVLGLARKPVLMMGIGFKDAETRNRREHATDSNLFFTTNKKEEISVNYIK